MKIMWQYFKIHPVYSKELIVQMKLNILYNNYNEIKREIDLFVKHKKRTSDTEQKMR